MMYEADGYDAGIRRYYHGEGGLVLMWQQLYCCQQSSFALPRC
jgi:hypothetical protein